MAATKNRKKLTPTAISRATPGEKKYVLWDTQVPGLGLRVYPAGTKAYVLRLVFPDPATGERRQRLHTLGDMLDFEDPDQAREKALDVRRQYRAGIDVKAEIQAEKSRLMTLREVLIGYHISREPRNKERTLIDTCSGLRVSYGHLLDKAMKAITADDVLQAYRERREVAPVRAGVDARYLRAVWNWTQAAYPHLELEPCPVDRIRKLGEWTRVERRSRRLTPETAPGWLKAVRALSQKRDAVLLETLYFTGCRIGEAQALRWSDMALDAKAPYFRLVDTKTRNTVELPLPRQVVTLLRSWQKEGPPTPFVFPAVSRAGELVSATYPGKVITAHRKASGIQWSPHDLRRTYISAAELAGVPSIVVRRLTNHAINSSDAHEGYAVAHVEDLAPWSQKVANRLQRWANQPGMVVELKTGTAYGN